MLHLELLSWSSVGGLSLGDHPVALHDGSDVYELISKFEQIKVENPVSYLGSYKHVVLIKEEVHLFDISVNKIVGSLGPYRIYKVGSDRNLLPVS